MARFGGLIGYLEREADVLRSRIETLRQEAPPEGGVTTDPGETPNTRQMREAIASLAEIEGYITELRLEAA